MSQIKQYSPASRCNRPITQGHSKWERRISLNQKLGPTSPMRSSIKSKRRSPSNARSDRHNGNTRERYRLKALCTCRSKTRLTKDNRWATILKPRMMFHSSNTLKIVVRNKTIIMNPMLKIQILNPNSIRTLAWEIVVTYKIAVMILKWFQEVSSLVCLIKRSNSSSSSKSRGRLMPMRSSGRLTRSGARRRRKSSVRRRRIFATKSRWSETWKNSNYATNRKRKRNNWKSGPCKPSRLKCAMNSSKRIMIVSPRIRNLSSKPTMNNSQMLRFPLGTSLSKSFLPFFKTQWITKPPEISLGGNSIRLLVNPLIATKINPTLNIIVKDLQGGHRMSNRGTNSMSSKGINSRGISSKATCREIRIKTTSRITNRTINKHTTPLMARTSSSTKSTLLHIIWTRYNPPPNKQAMMMDHFVRGYEEILA